MNIYIKNLSKVRISRGDESVRFSVTFAGDDGEPLLTQQGWLFNRRRRVTPPKTNINGTPVQLITISDVLELRLRTALESIPEVREILGLPDKKTEVPLNVEKRKV